MNYIALLTLIIATVTVLVAGMRRPSGILQFPFLAAAVCGAWFVPQAIGLVDDLTLPKGAYPTTMLYAAACMAAIWFGYKPASAPPVNRETFNERRLLIAAAVMSLIGGAAYTQIFRTPVTVNEQGLTTGIVTIFFFFSKLQYFGLALALLLLLKRFSLFALIIVALNLNMIMGFVLFGGRRGPAVEVTMILLTCFWFQRRFIPPRTLILTLVVFGMIFGNSVGNYRSTVALINSNSEEVRLPTLSEISQIDFMENFRDVVTSGSFEVNNAVHTIGASSDTLRFTYGVPYWNFFIFSYVPAQLVGRATKDALTLEQPDIRYETYGYIGHIGMTSTGFADSFAAFWMFGVLVFYGFSRMLSRWWSMAMSGSLMMQFLYATSITTAMHSITHSTQWFIAFLPYCLGLYWAVSKFALKRQTKRHGPVRPYENQSRVTEQ